jgi:hypothetical protein
MPRGVAARVVPRSMRSTGTSGKRSASASSMRSVPSALRLQREAGAVGAGRRRGLAGAAVVALQPPAAGVHGHGHRASQRGQCALQPQSWHSSTGA